MTAGPVPGPVPIAVGRGAAARGGSPPGGVLLAALGDLMLAGEWQEAAARGRLTAGLADLGALTAEADLVFANLETTCPGSEGLIPKEPRVVAEPAVVGASLEALAVGLVNLANNHAFDAYRSGFEAACRVLDERGIVHLGAGADAARAGAPLRLERRGLRFGFLAYADRATRPSHLAAAGGYGVNPLDPARAAAEVEALRSEVDHVVVSLHWGVEYCHLPSPEQVATARALVDAGARLVIGHHAHVVQGVETRGAGAVIYNLGNATTTDHRVGGRLAVRQTPRTRSSFVLRAWFGADRLEALELVPIRSTQAAVRVDDPFARTVLERARGRLAGGVTPARWRRVRLYEDVLVRTARKLDPRVIASVRPRHVVTLGRNLWRALHGRQPV